MKEYLGGRRINQNKRMYENVTRQSGISNLIEKYAWVALWNCNCSAYQFLHLSWLQFCLSSCKKKSTRSFVTLFSRVHAIHHQTLILPSRTSILCHTHLYHYYLHKLKLCLNWLFFHQYTHKLFIHIAKLKYECSYKCPQGLHYLLLQIPTSAFISNIIY